MIVDLLPTDEQQMIIDSIDTLLDRQLSMTRFTDRSSWAAGAEHAVWKDLVEFDLFGFGCQEAGAGGYGAAEEVLAVRSLGRRCVSATVIATMLAARIAHEARQGELAEGFRGGTACAAFANPLGDGAFHVIDSTACDWIVVLERPLRMMPRDAGLHSAELSGHDETVRLERLQIAPGIECIESDLFDYASLLLSAYLTGIAQATVRMASEYAKVRVQFGQPIGAFQAVKHRCADMAVRAAAAEAQTFYSTVIGQEGRPFKRETACARFLSRIAATQNAKDNVQIHGAMGFTAESEAHIYLKRALLVGALGSDFRAEQARIMAGAPSSNSGGASH